MLKVTIISWVIFVVLYITLKVMAISMSDEEKLVYKFKEELPTRCVVLTLLLLLSFLESLVVTIITIVKW